MAMVSTDMADAIIGSINQSTEASDAINKFYKGLCDYVEANAEVFYSWAGVNPSGTPDPQVMLDCKIQTTGSLSPSGASDCNTALAIFSADLNTQAALWQIIFPVGFALSPAFVIPTINITPSMATEQKAAMDAICAQIIAGLKAATPVASGAHAAFVGAASFIQIL